MSIQERLMSLPWNKKIEVLQVIEGLNQNEAAEKCGTGQKVYWNWINGKSYPRKNSQKAIAAAFGVTVNDIFGADSHAC